MQVLKFGGSSVATAENLKKVAAISVQAMQQKPAVVVVSALGGVTDQLLAAGNLAAGGNEQYRNVLQQLEQRHLDMVRELLPVTSQSATLSLVKQHFNTLESICDGVFLLQELSLRIKDKIAAYGEKLSSQILSAYLHAQSVAHELLEATELIRTSSDFGNATVYFSATNLAIKNKLEEKKARLYVTQGFTGSDEKGQITTLGRGGSDYTAAIFAAALPADVLEIWTDVSGMMTADPRLVSNARIIPHISYQEAMELSHFGAKVIYPPTVQPVMSRNIPVLIKNTFKPEDPGTFITQQAPDDGELIRGISSIPNMALLSLEGSGMVGIPGFSRRLFDALAAEKINVILITQSSSEHSICVAVNEAEADAAKHAVDKEFVHEITSGGVEPLRVERSLCVVAVVGDQMKSHPGISGKMFEALGRNGINVRAIAQGSSEKNISAVLSMHDVKKAINVLHEAFFESGIKQLNLFVAGAGNVGGKLLEQLKQQKQFLMENFRLQINVIGLTNSRKMVLKEEGVNLDRWQEELAAGTDMSLDGFVEEVRKRNLRNSVFADVTANAEVAGVYERLLEKSVSVVACNKIACSSAYPRYKKLKSLASEYNALFLFETNVGAGLPVISTLNDLIKSGDRVHSIEAVLSGTLNFVFNHYNGTATFSEVVRQAQAEGYTEPDPRLDLSGTDVMRKIMILAREAGQVLEMDGITNNMFLPDSCIPGTVEDFYQAMVKEEAHFKKLYDDAAAKGCRLKFVASFKEGKASVGLQQIPPGHDFYDLKGKDNVVLFHTARYPELPLVVKGAGAGADVTASGVFADIIRIARI
ncbi:bifunctional aspartate kinase/homoserine dehydrogenase I [Parasegetibacter sp. NRK P23]|uniref:bifunctional aspartate kinase/homoserine dehydrogenase I n=1 Tax=Parasegetibacter sp. NRK P23 TaxID=2942999 RepID=UPI0020446CD2|nr:bifunctional aspartate kinase/homoserine dehydrogenase I [Parasegetibacter sp. NRK P23]MCM5527045.1 bifunctional aspartate kinase/homoserine dehydrogenase I [Parasegetibacter sp. NRK P23]